jgi:D-serine deaminase-like pyridoxal phosphate-dependent protein
VIDPVARALQAMHTAGVPVEILSGGSTPAAEFSSEVPGLTEIRPGTYVYNDLNTFYQGACRLDDCAVRVMTTVVSTAVPGRAMVDAGSKTLSSDQLTAGPKAGFGYIVEAPDAPLFMLSEEHGHVDMTRSEHQFRVGEVLSVIPNHICTCVNMHDEAFLVRNQEVIGSWRVAGRGKIR